MKLTIIGTGYVGLVTGTCFAEVGHHVVCVDNDAAKVKPLQAGGIPIYEPGLEELVKKNVAAGRLKFTTSTAEGVQKSDVIFIAVPTPPQPDGSVDLSFIENVARDIAAAMTDYKIVVDKSTVPVKTGEKVAETIKRYCTGQGGFRRGQQSRISARRFCRRRFDEARPRCHRRPLAAARRGDEGNLHAVQRADHRHRHQLRRTHQARGEFLSRAENFLHQRHRHHLRGRRRERAGSRRTASGWTSASAAGSSTPASASAAVVFPRT